MATNDELETTEEIQEVSLSPDAVRNSPEYRALVRQLRNAEKRLAAAERAASEARAAAEEARQAAEAERRMQEQERIRSILGDEGVALWSEIAELSATDQVAAAERLAALLRSRAQSVAPEPTPHPPAQQEEQVTQSPPSLPTGIAASQPLRPVTDEMAVWDEVIEASQSEFDRIVELNQNLLTRNRVTERERRSGIMAYLAGAYAKAFKTRGVRPRAQE